MKICVVPGSFDPFTLGHLDIVRRASLLFDKVYVAVMVNGGKRGMFELEQRRKLAEASCEGIENAEVIVSEGLLYELCEQLGACAVVKGVRNAVDYAYECELADINRHLSPTLETVLLAARPELGYISSTCVRELIRYGKPLDSVLHPEAIRLASLSAQS